MISISDKYNELKSTLGKHEIIIIQRGVKNRQGAFVVPPMGDPDHGGLIPMLRKRFIKPGTKAAVLGDLAPLGWFEFADSDLPVIPESVKAVKKPSTTAKRLTGAATKRPGRKSKASQSE